MPNNEAFYGGGPVEKGFEFSYRRTPGGRFAHEMSVEDIYRNSLFDLFVALTQAQHYGEADENFPVAASAPILTDTHPNPYRIISSSNLKPYKGSRTRVCGERPMLSLRARNEDISMRLLMLAAKKDLKNIVETSKHMQSLHCCGFCRPVVAKAFGTDALLATYTNEDLFEFTDGGANPLNIIQSPVEELPRPKEVFSLGAMVLYHEFEGPYPSLGENVDVVEAILQTLGRPTDFHALNVDKYISYRIAPGDVVTPAD